ncbi:MAG: hypothetical protein EAX91_07510 [Candidatus Lokiarchaeota archaeon]|nr:hypothetical protein [Candidatus Lokiarchaeota archaeon]
MEKIKIYILYIYNLIPAPIYGLLSAIVGLSGDVISVLLFQGYNLNHMMSALGTGPGGIFFNMGTFLSGIFALLFYLHLIKVMGKETNDRKLYKAWSIFTIISCILFSLIGVFPTSKNTIIFLLHGTFTLISLLSAILYLTLFGYLISKSNNFPRFFVYLALITTVTIVVFLFTWIPITEWTMALAVAVWITLISAYMLYYKI